MFYLGWRLGSYYFKFYASSLLRQCFGGSFKQLWLYDFNMQSKTLCIRYSEITLPSNKLTKFLVGFPGTTFPSLIATEEEVPLFTPVGQRWIDLYMLEMGYLHIQATKPDTVG